MKKIAVTFIALIIHFSMHANLYGQAIHVEVSGKGHPILFIPGFTVPGEVWEPVVKALESTYECHVITLAGFGGKEPIGFPWLPQVNEAIKDYIVSKDLQGATIIGHSLGGTVATWLATQSDLSLAQLVLVDALPAAGALMFPDFNPDNLAYESPYNKQQLDMTDAAFEQMATFMSKGMSIKEAEQKRIHTWMLEADRETYVYGYTDYLKLDMREGLKAISIPVTIIAATNPYGEAMVRQTYTGQYANLNDYSLVIAEDSAHFVMLDKPDWFMEQIQQILASKK
ncbi:alpha/beta fold hydrolase [Mongoliitalea daihaiensis]|uniref:alpha/beta fold hydrolase n=1 Tax=Mongoliitalea daihaiensis TaxID=2782006 RepID=UPI001F31ED0C|nr:alpha/beta hydrolase [Mongoliitalea daihaiensis]UJP65105.1 alpha/beta hydrolase [Mongoliitalea daihaiensis]